MRHKCRVDIRCRQSNVALKREMECDEIVFKVASQEMFQDDTSPFSDRDTEGTWKDGSAKGDEPLSLLLATKAAVVCTIRRAMSCPTASAT